ncbi:GGDEF domain-containing protein [Sulfurimonas sp.]|uniref:GGDEF domain-containing protein n=1 Tax=Sulfurimonas sp. TaxID=2022749 RepID=UPI00262132D9|nr:GGDEF domain-containing protein [Sulfurimonas sp.]MCW8895311.1 GGDEF domain-containing protein [Sulfurimonas sp.]MCW9067329.1 GGDEF domain-containing protein [Sulfurimonas sp.]
MKTKSRLLIIVTFMLLGLTAATIINISLNFRDYSIKSAVEKAQMASNIVKDGLTSHMVHGIMDKRQYFLNQISSNPDVEFLRLIRADSVVKQYGPGLNEETLRDAIDKEVMRTGEMVKSIKETSKAIKLRVTIPYKATVDNSESNCLNCHNVQKDEVLGAISMEFDISHMRNSGMMTILKILGINLLFIVIALILINYYVAPYMKLFSNLQTGVKMASLGDFTHKFSSKVGGDAKKVIDQMNSLFGKMQETFGDIKENLSTFVPQGCATSSNDPLYEANTIINELSDIYKFKKTIELDESKDMVYFRIIDILKLKYEIEDFTFYQINNVTQKRLLIHSCSDSICFDNVDHNAGECRAYRTKSDVISTEFVNLCQNCDPKGLEYVCIPFNINADSSLLISIKAKTPDEVNKITSSMASIKNYLEAAKPVIESRILMDKLRDTSLRDGMTGLYNRRFLEELIDKIMSQATRNDDTYHVMMLDVDFFKMVNDTYGHDIGDKVIVELAAILKNSIRSSDLAIRYGGEEFVIMLQNATKESAMKIAKKIHSQFGNTIFDVAPNESIQKTMSIGIAKFPTDGDTIWKCIKYADTALYEAKNTGRNKIVEFKPEMYQSGEDF